MAISWLFNICRFKMGGILLLSMLALTGCGRPKEGKSVPHIAILQDKPQEWADALKAGFNDGLKEQGLLPGTDVVVIARSAGGDPQALSTIADSFIQGDYAAIYTLGTQ